MNITKNYPLACELLTLIRKYHGLTQTQLSYKLELESTSVANIENGEEPSLMVLGKYAEFFSIPVDSLIFFTNLKQGATFKIRRYIGMKVISILKWGMKI